MKKLLILLLVLSMAFVFIACDKTDDNVDNNGNNNGNNNNETPCTSHTDSNSDYKCDTCGVDVGSANPGLSLSNAVLAQLEAAASMKVELDFTFVLDETEWLNNGDGSYTEETDYADGIGKFTVILSKNANGGYNAKVDVDAKTRETADGEYTVLMQNTLVYMVDNVLYTYDAESETYIVDDSSDESAEEIVEMLTALTAGVEITEAEEAEFLKALGDSFIASFDMKNGKGSVSFNAKEDVTAAIAYIAALNLETDTVADVLNDILALVDKDLTITAIVTELQRISGLTVNAAIAELDAKLTQEYQTTLQGLYDKVVNDARFIALVTNATKLSMAESGMSETDIDAYVQQTIAGVKQFKISDFIAANEMGDALLYDLIASLVAANMPPVDNGDGTTSPATLPAKDELFGMINAILGAKLGEFDEQIGKPIFTVLKETASGITFNELNGKLDVNFKNIFNLDSVYGEFNFDAVMKTPVTADKSNVNHIIITLKLNVSGISTLPVEIVVPTDKIAPPAAA